MKGQQKERRKKEKKKEKEEKKSVVFAPIHSTIHSEPVKSNSTQQHNIMDLSKLSSNLPLSSSPTDESISNLNKELSDEFKIGARSIAALYRLSNSKNSLLIARGYLDCLNEISTYLENGNISSLAELSHFITAKKHEMAPETAASTPHEEMPPRDNLVQSGIDTSFKFTVNQPTDHHFPHSRAPLSVDNHNLRYYSKPHQHQKKLKSKASAIANANTNAANAAAPSSDEEEYVNASQDDEERAGVAYFISGKSHTSPKSYLSSGIDEHDEHDYDYHNDNTSFEEATGSANTLKRKTLDNASLYKKQKLDS